jgi:hypothetical protein
MYLPVDFIKTRLIDFDSRRLLNNPLLDFMEVTNTKTGEIVPYVYAKYKDLTFKVFIDGGVVMHGSLHKFSNNGEHNYNQFTESKFLEVLGALKEELGIEPYNLYIIQLECGLNLAPPVDSNDILEGCIEHKQKTFDKNRRGAGMWIQVEHNKYILKLYNKAAQYGQLSEILRIEMKYMNWSNYRSLGIKTLQDFIDYNGDLFVKDLLAQWDSVYFYDPTIKTDKYIHYRDAQYWSDLQKMSSRTTIKRHKDRLDRIGHEEGNGLKNEIRRLLIENLNSLQGGNEL